MDRTASSPTCVIGRRRTALLAASALALVLAAAPGRVVAQAYQGSGTVPAGAGGAVITPGLNTTTIDVTAPNTVINWTPTDTSGPAVIDFLPAGTTATYRSDLTDYTVLNRILPSTQSAIGLNGTIQSTVFDPNTQGQVTGGNLWFYTPYGFVVGSNATINVGGLLLTTNDVGYTLDATSGQANFLDANGAVNLRGAAGSGAGIVNNSLSATGISASSYIAFVAPRIEQRGKVTADRSIAYVAGESVDLKINAGMFDIAVLTGTTDAEGIVHAGTTTGSQSTGFFDTKTISMVAIPKNDALTMMLSGSIGYAPAASLFNDGSAIVLVAGDGASPAGNIAIGNTDFANSLDAHATGDLVASVSGSAPQQSLGAIRFGNYAYLSGDNSVSLVAGPGGTITADQPLSLYADGTGGTGGTVTVTALGAAADGTPAGTIAVSGYLQVSASRYGSTSEDSTIGTDGTGGAVRLLADGGSIATGSLYAYAEGYGGSGTVTAGDGYGGSIEMRAGYGGSITSNYTYLGARGAGGYGAPDATGGEGVPGDGTGGTIILADSGTTLGLDSTGGSLALGFVNLNATGDGGYTGSGLDGGNGFGGAIDLSIGLQDQSWDYLSANVSGYDGSGSFDPVGGTLDMAITGGAALTVLGGMDLYADAVAGVDGGPGAFGTGGAITLTVDQGGRLEVFDSSRISASAFLSGLFLQPDSTPDLTGGTIDIRVDGAASAFVTGNLYAYADATNSGADTLAGFAKGGTVTATASNGGLIDVVGVDGTQGFAQITANGIGGNGVQASDAAGGLVALAALSGGRIDSLNPIELSASAGQAYVADTGGLGNSGTAGTVDVHVIGGTIAPGVQAYAIANGGYTPAGPGGDNVGGTINLVVLQGGSFLGSFVGQAYGAGGDSDDGDGGSGTGGRFTMATDATAALPGFALDFTGYGRGGTGAGGTGGDGIGGSALIDILGGQHDWDHATVLTFAQAAFPGGAGSLTGSATGDPDGIVFHVGEGASLAIANGITLDARALGRVNGGTNTATGGAASLFVDSGAALTAGFVYADASATIDGGEIDAFTTDTSPNATGGHAVIVADGGTLSAPLIEAYANGETSGALTAAGEARGGTATVGAANGGVIRVEGQGRAVGLYVEAQGLGGEGPSAAAAFGGHATVFAQGGTIVSPYDLTVSADAMGGSFSGTFTASGIAGNGFDATGGLALVEMAGGSSGTGGITVPSLTVSAIGDASGADLSDGAGGDGTGGTARLQVADGTLTTGAITLLATGAGGMGTENIAGGPAYRSGNGTGGLAEFALLGGTVATTGITADTTGTGAIGDAFTSGATPSIAGNGQGGSVRFVADGGTLSDSGGVTLVSRGYGGAGAFNPNPGPGGDGGSATGGTVSFVASPGSTAALEIAGAISLVANAEGSIGGFASSGPRGAAGAATGGSAAMALSDIAFSFGTVSLDASGFAASGTASFGTGGNASFALADAASGPATPRTIASLDLQARGDGVDGSTGGTVAFTSAAGSAGSGLAVTGAFTAIASGSVPPSGLGFAGIISGAPVTVGSTATILTPGDANLAIADTGALVVTGDLTIDVGGAFASTGLLSTLVNATVRAPGGIAMTDLSAGGTTLLAASGGPVVVSRDLMSGGLVTVRGTAVDIVSLGALAFADADATGGGLSIATEGDLDLATVDATGAVTLSSTAGTIHATGAVNGTDLALVAGGDVVSDTMLAANGNLTVAAGGLFITPTASASATGNVSLSADLGLDLAAVVSGGTTLLRADSGAIVVDSLTSPGAVTASGRSVSITSPGALAFTGANATAGDLSLTTAGNLGLAAGSATGAVALTSGGGSISGTGPIASDGPLSAQASLGIALGTVTSGGTAGFAASGGPVTITDLNAAGSASAQGTAIAIGSTGGLAVSDARATAGALAITAAQGLNVGTASATGTLALAAGGDLATSGAVTGGGVSLSGANVTLGGSVDSSAALAITARQTLAVNARATGRTIDAVAADIGIGSAGQLGSRGTTQAITLATGSPSAPLSVGGAGTGTGYRLDKAEAARLFADSTITIAGGAGDIAVGELALSFGSAGTANIGTGGTFKLDTSGNVTVSGAVTLATASAGDTFSIDPARIDVIAGSGSIALLGSGGTPLGTLVLDGGTIAVASRQTIDAIGSASDFAAIAALLDQPGPAGPAGGYLQAGTIAVSVDNGFFIQNAGTGTAYDDRRGFAAQALSIHTGEGSPQISINGVLLAPGGPITGLAVAPLVTINEAAAVDYAGAPVPTVNGCAVNVDCARPDLPGQSRSDLEQPLSSEGTAQGDGGDALLANSLLVSLSETQPLIAPPVVDEPITGVGNDDFWQVHCEPGDDRAECPAGDRED
ncbi:hypothetical protein N0B51_00580 [Tsuneonella sp. YG55]|uniref:Filamentous haemagglutinin FhaB/tRNA nuclease CdiA-like TPS domain-containing protein n=1 Tax=Tsuneonella litorea TaxID=2976475 RepID=A0A9X2VYH8_9SPHN|nr:hypothetical protein [Tsuneonella litorea]MCT2557466.1 hypothetical protein [Tsuneonella litorea]